MAPAVVSDSNVSLPGGLVSGLPLFLAPLEVRIGGQVYADGVDITANRFYELIATSSDLPTTSAPRPGAFLEAFERAGAVSNEIVCVTLSAELSATYKSAAEAVALAKTQFPDLDITLIDSRSAGTAQGLIVLDAARAAVAGAPREEVVSRIQMRMADTMLLGYISSMYHLWRGGRVPRALMWMGKLLSVKPILQLADGAIGMVERPRTEAKAMRRLAALAEKRLAGRRGRLAVMHAAAPDKADLFADSLRATLDIEELFITEFTPVIGAHTGPGLVGCALHPV